MQSLTRLFTALLIATTLPVLAVGCDSGGDSEPHCEGVEPAPESEEECAAAGGEWVVPPPPTPASSSSSGGTDFCEQVEKKADKCNVDPPWGSCSEPDSPEALAEAQCFLGCVNDASCSDVREAVYDEDGPLVWCVESNCQ